MAGRVAALGAFTVLLVAPANAPAHTVDALTDRGPRVAAAEPPLTATPQAECGPGPRPETDIQGRVPSVDYDSGRVAEGYTCNAELVGSFVPETPNGIVGGLKVERYVDAQGHECAFYDSTLLLPGNPFNDQGVGVFVLDMSNSARPVKTAQLTTPAMLSPHESLVLSSTRGLLAAVSGSAATYPGIVDVYDVSRDCRYPELLSSSPVGVLGHESGFSPDGRTFYAASFASETIVAVNLDDPRAPVPIWLGPIGSHGLSISDDGNRAYVAALDVGDIVDQTVTPGANVDAPGMLILDTSEIQARTLNPQVRTVSALTWSTVSSPQNAIPITIGGHPYVVEVDEFSSQQRVGAARIIDIADEKQPVVVSNLRLAVHQPENFPALADDPGVPSISYSAHYCNVPTRHDPGIVACSMIGSGLRVFDIRDPLHPREVGYFNAPLKGGLIGSSFAMASPAFAPERREIWYTDANSGFYAVRLINGAWPDTATPVVAPPPPGPGASSPAVAGTGTLAASGWTPPLAAAGACLLAALALRRASRNR